MRSFARKRHEPHPSIPLDLFVHPPASISGTREHVARVQTPLNPRDAQRVAFQHGTLAPVMCAIVDADNGVIFARGFAAGSDESPARRRASSIDRVGRVGAHPEQLVAVAVELLEFRPEGFDGELLFGRWLSQNRGERLFGRSDGLSAGGRSFLDRGAFKHGSIREAERRHTGTDGRDEMLLSSGASF